MTLHTLHIICSFLYSQEYTMSSICMLWLLALHFYGTPNGKSRHGSDSFTCSWVPFTQIGLPCPWGYEDFYAVSLYPVLSFLVVCWRTSPFQGKWKESGSKKERESREILEEVRYKKLESGCIIWRKIYFQLRKSCASIFIYAFYHFKF